MTEREKLRLKPGDYIVFSGGLKIENISLDHSIEFELPEKYSTHPYETVVATINPTPSSS
jgi:hypothetical protein